MSYYSICSLVLSCLLIALYLRLLSRGRAVTLAPPPVAMVFLCAGAYLMLDGVRIAGAGITQVLIERVADAGGALQAALLERILEPVTQALMLTLQALAALAWAAFCVRVPVLLGGTPRWLGIGQASPVRGVIQGAIALLLLVPGWYPLTELNDALVRWVGLDAGPQATVELLQHAIHARQHGIVLLLAVLAVICAPLAEELLFRGLIFRWLAARFGMTSGVLVSAALFAALHWTPAALLPLFVLGAVLAAIHGRTGSLWPCIALHSLFNGTQIAMAWMQMK